MSLEETTFDKVITDEKLAREAHLAMFNATEKEGVITHVLLTLGNSQLNEGLIGHGDSEMAYHGYSAILNHLKKNNHPRLVVTEKSN